MKKNYLGLILFALVFCCCSEEEYPDIVPLKPPVKPAIDTAYMKRAEATFDKVFELYWYNNMKVMYDKYPNNLATNTNTSTYDYDLYAFVWGYGSILSAYNTVYQKLPSSYNFERNYKSKVMDGLARYYNTSKQPPAYACFPNTWDDRFYDDNMWLGIDLVELYDKTKESEYLEKAKTIWTFILSGKDNELGGGIYWKEKEKDSKNTCSNAPAAVLGMKLFSATKDSTYLTTAKELYQWTKANLQDGSDYLYWDNIKVPGGTVEKNKFSYNSGQMLQAAVLLYNVTKNETYLTEARQIAESAHNYFFEQYTPVGGEAIPMLRSGSLWFHAIMLRGFAELYQVDKDRKYIDSFKKSLDYGWKNARDPQTGLFSSDLSGRTTDAEKNLLTQGAIIEMYARVAALQ